VDNGGANDGRGIACLHVLEAAAGDAYRITIEGSGGGKHWTTAWYLEPQVETTRWKLGNAVRGKLNTSAYLAY